MGGWMGSIPGVTSEEHSLLALNASSPWPSQKACCGQQQCSWSPQSTHADSNSVLAPQRAETGIIRTLTRAWLVTLAPPALRLARVRTPLAHPGINLCASGVMFCVCGVCLGLGGAVAGAFGGVRAPPTQTATLCRGLEARIFKEQQTTFVRRRILHNLTLKALSI